MTVPSDRFKWQGNGCAPVVCDNCGDSMIHLYKRGPNESSSALGQWVHDNLPHNFGWSDADGISRVRLGGSLPTLRFFEQKKRSSAVSDSQRHIFRTFSQMFDLAIDNRIISSQSGVFVVRSDPPWTSARVYSYGDRHDRDTVDIDQSQLVRLVSGRDWYPGTQMRLA